jgi:hypothetical protein
MTVLIWMMLGAAAVFLFDRATRWMDDRKTTRNAENFYQGVWR